MNTMTIRFFLFFTMMSVMACLGMLKPGYAQRTEPQKYSTVEEFQQRRLSDEASQKSKAADPRDTNPASRYPAQAQQSLRTQQANAQAGGVCDTSQLGFCKTQLERAMSRCEQAHHACVTQASDREDPSCRMVRCDQGQPDCLVRAIDMYRSCIGAEVVAPTPPVMTPPQPQGTR